MRSPRAFVGLRVAAPAVVIVAIMINLNASLTAWGPSGHRIVADVATAYLDPGPAIDAVSARAYHASSSDARRIRAMAVACAFQSRVSRSNVVRPPPVRA
jgi:hypothetical protein